MRPKTLVGIVATGALLGSLCIGGAVSARKKELSTTRGVTIDGNAFVADEPPSTGGSILERELGRFGVRLPAGFAAGDGPGGAHPVFSGRLKDAPPRAPDAPWLPAGLIPEHTLRMEGEGAPVDLVFGKLGTPGPSVRIRLTASGWKSVTTGNVPGVVHVLQDTRGKETSIVCLDEAEGTFLHFRELGR